MHTTTTTTPPGLPDGKRPSWAQRHPFWAAFLGGIAAVAVLAAAFSAWRIADAPSSSPARAAGPAASASAAPHKAHHHARSAPAKTVYVTPPAPQAAPPAPAVGQAPINDLRQVEPGVYANQNTSDAFAENVVLAWNGTFGTQYVYSPVTGATYAMTYTDQGNGTVIATGGNSAYVEFPG